MTEPAQRRTNDDGSKYYEHPSRTEEVREGGGGMITVRPARYVSVTTALTVCAKPALVYWAANKAAERAMANLPKLIAAARIDDCGRARAKSEPHGCKVCAACIEAWVALYHEGEKQRRAREGSAVHDTLDRWVKTGEWAYIPRADWEQYAPTPDEMAPYILTLKTFIADYGLTPESWLIAECTVWHHVLRYAGTLDGVIVIKPITKVAADFCARINAKNELPADQPVIVVIDCKSREGDGAAFYKEQPLQLGAYRFAETMTPRRGAGEMEISMLATDGAAVLQIRPDGYTFRPVVTDGNTMKAFRAVLDQYAWDSEHGDESTLVRAFPRPDGWKPPTWQRATDPTGSLCGCAYCDDPGDSRCMFAGVRPLGRHTKTVPAPKPVLPPSAKIGVSGGEEKPSPRKRAPRKAPGAPSPVGGTSATMASMIDRQRIAGAGVPDDGIPF